MILDTAMPAHADSGLIWTIKVSNKTLPYQMSVD
jgi:hypothetical protein